MQSFNGSQVVKDEYVARVKAHMAADEIIQGTYWENGKGCAVGCTVHSGNHKDYETELGLPTWLAYLEDRLFERMSNSDAKGFPLAFLESIPVGIDEEQFATMRNQFLSWLLIDPEHGVIKFTKMGSDSYIVVELAGRLLRDGGTDKELRNARIQARTAADAAADAADAAAYAYAYAYAADARKQHTRVMTDKLCAMLAGLVPVLGEH